MEKWQVEVGGQIYEAGFDELGQWIAEGALLPADKVRRGNLRWLEAGKVPLLYGFFNAKELGLPMTAVPTIADASAAPENPQVAAENFATTQIVNQNKAEDAPAAMESWAANGEFINQIAAPASVCAVHPEAEPFFVCQTCANVFCKACPNSYGGTVKICPLCGAMCERLHDAKQSRQQKQQRQQAIAEGFGFGDFGSALALPFKFKTSFIFGLIIYIFFTIGQGAVNIGGVIMIFSAVVCAMMANALTFGILANTVENFSQGNLHVNFMPDFDDFSLWDGVVHPFFLSIGAYLVSFGLMIIIAVGGAWYAWSSLAAPSNPAGESFQHSAAFEKAKEIERFEAIKRQLNDNNQFKNGTMPDENQINQRQSQPMSADDLIKSQETINQNQAAQIESLGKQNQESEAEMNWIMFVGLIKAAAIFLIPLALSFLWGLFYFPAACAVAGYTRSFSAVMNPANGLDTIRRLGTDYLKIIFFCFLIVIVFAFVNVILHFIFAPFDIPHVGNIPVTIISGAITFYISIVFSAIIGYALYKNSEKLNLYRG